MRGAKLICLIFFAFLPSSIKISILRARGAVIGKGCKIGISIVDAKNMNFGDYVEIGNLNLIWRLSGIDLETGSKIGDGNWITGGRTGSLRLGRNSSIRRFHYLEASGGINIGNNSIIAGRGSQFFTHGLHPDSFEQIKPIRIEDWCYIGAFCKFAPGVVVSKGSFVGLGAVLSKEYEEGYVLLVGNPAVIKKRLSPQSMYFQQGFLPLGHHPKGYLG